MMGRGDPCELIDYAVTVTADMEQCAYVLAADLEGQEGPEGAALDIALHLSRVLKRLRELQRCKIERVSASSSGEGAG